MHHTRTALLAPVILATLTSLSNPSAAQMRIATEEVEDLRAVMETRSESGRIETMPLIQERLQVVIDNQHATTTVKQTYANRTGAVLEGRYALKAGLGTRVEGFAYWNGEKKIVGEVFEKEAARAVYEGVTRRRRDPGLLEETGDGAFTFQVFPIQAAEKKRVEVSYSKWLGRHGKSIRYRAPVTSPRAEVVVEIRSARKVHNVRSSSHAISIDPLRGGGVRVRANRRRAGGSFELSYELVEPAWNVNAMVHKDPGHDGYFTASLAAPPNLNRKVAAKDVTIVLDRSGSMTGEPLDQAKLAAENIIRRLGVADRVNVVSFDDDVDPLYDQPARATDKNRNRAVRFVRNIDAGGGTDLALALKTAVAAQSDTQRPRVVLFLTDGQSDARAAIAAAREDKRDVRVFAVGLGTGVNKELLSRLSRLKRGHYTQIEDSAAIERNISLVYSHISRPLLVDVSFDVVGAASDRRVYPRTIPDLFLDDELVIRGRLRGESGTVTFIVSGRLDGKPVTYRKRMKLGSAVKRPWVGRLWARARVDHLLEDLALDGSQVEKKREVIELAVAYNFVTKFTSFLAIPADEATGDARRALDDARARKREVLRKHRDAVALKQGAPSPRSPTQAADFGDDDDDDDDDDGDYDSSDEGDDAELTSAHPGGARKKSGCAGCASSERGGLGAMCLVLLGLAMTRRRRQR